MLEKYSKYIRFIFHKYASASAADKKSVSMADKSVGAMSFTEVMRMLKEKGLTRIPKMTINDIMTKINYHKRKERNLLGGIYQPDFGNFLIQLTHVSLLIDNNRQDLPFGFHLKSTMRTLLEGETLSKEFNDEMVAHHK